MKCIRTIDVVENDVWALPSQFQRYRFEVALSRGYRNDLSNLKHRIQAGVCVTAFTIVYGLRLYFHLNEIPAPPFKLLSDELITKGSLTRN